MRKILIAIVMMVCGRASGQGISDKEEMLISTFPTVGAYFWCDYGKHRNEIFFDFAEKNKVTEIYLAQRDIDYKTPDIDYFEKTKYFLEMAHKRNLKVFLLLGSQSDTITVFKLDLEKISTKIEQAIDYNKQVPDSLKFAGIHLDIEFDKIKDDEKYEIFSEWIVQSGRQYRKHIKMDFSIVKYTYKDKVDCIERYREVEYDGKMVELYKVVINEGDRTFIQSYHRNNACSISDYVRPFIEYAAPKNKTIIYTIQPIDFKGGYKQMYKQMELLYNMTEYKNTGIAIHTLTSWFIKAAEE